MSEDKRRKKGEENLEAISKSAEILFAEKGYEGTSIKDIAEKAGLPKGSIYYYYPKKEDIYEAVKSRSIKGYAKQQQEIFSGEGKMDRHAIDQAIKKLIRFFKENEVYRKLYIWSVIENNHKLWDGEAELMQGIVYKLKEEQKKGGFPKEINPGYLMIMIWGMITYWFQYVERYKRIMEVEGDNDQLCDAYMEQSLKVLLNGVFRE